MVILLLNIKSHFPISEYVYMGGGGYNFVQCQNKLLVN